MLTPLIDFLPQLFGVKWDSIIPGISEVMIKTESRYPKTGCCILSETV
jgi:hypothetical protein